MACYSSSEACRISFAIGLIVVQLQSGLYGQDGATASPIPGLIEPPFAWNRTDQYAPPDARHFFPDDADAGKTLTECLSGTQEWPASVDERLALIRQGLRQMTGHRTLLLGAIGNEFIWNKESQDPRAIELLYHASDLAATDVAHYAFYHGPSVVSERTPNLVRSLMERYYGMSDQDQSRIAWGMKTYGDRNQTRELLSGLLDSHEKLEEPTICAAIETYRAVFESEPPEMQRFAGLGKWLIAFHRTDLSASHPRAAKILREQTDHLMRGNEQLVLDFVTRVDDGHETAVVLIQGEQARRDFTNRLEQHVFARVDFSMMLSPRVLRTHRLREFANHLPQGLPQNSRPVYSRPEVNEQFSYSAAAFIPPSFTNYFEDNPHASQELDDVYERRENLELKDRELLHLFRRGFRRSSKTPNELFGWIAGAIGWPRDPMLDEIFFQATDTTGRFDVRDSAVYYGYNLHQPKTHNMLEMLYRCYMSPPFDRTANGNFRSRILWSIRDHEDDRWFLATQFANGLQNHTELSTDALRLADSAYLQLTGSNPPNQQEYQDRIVDLVGFVIPGTTQIEQAKKDILKRLGSPDYLVDTELTVDQTNIQVLAIVQGPSAAKSLSLELKSSPVWPINLVIPWTDEFCDEMGSKLPDRFRNHLPATK